MIARLNTKASRAPCTPTPTRRCKRTSGSLLSAAHRLLQHKNMRCSVGAARARIPLATKTNGVQPQLTFNLPRTLPRPASVEVDTTPIAAAYPELAGVTPEYIRERLPISGAQMLHALANTHPSAQPSTSTLPRELEIVMNDIVSAACPTHMLAVYSTSTPSASTHKRKVTLFPTHQLILSTHCANLPSLPTPTASSSTTTRTLPITPLALPSAETFPLLQSYLYTKDAHSLLASLLPSPNCVDMLALGKRAMLINGLWRNACALGVVQEQGGLWDVIDQAWEGVVGAIEQSRAAQL